MPDQKLYIAYGSNLNVRQMRWRCPDAMPVGVGILDGWQLLFKGSKTGSYLTVDRSQGSCVPVAVWAVSAEDERRLDRYEGYPDFYYKKVITLPVEDLLTGKVRKKKAFIYIMHEERAFGIPSMDYVQTCLEGYRNFGFKTAPLVRAYRISEEVCNGK